MAKKTPETKSRQRSPNYPAVSLPTAVDVVKRLVDHEGKAGAPADVAIRRMGFSGLHGHSRAVLSALKKFGLIEDRGGRLVPTDMAISIVRFPRGSERREGALREAALRPAIYQDVLNRYLEHGELPSDETLRPELITDWDFNPKVADSFLEGLRASLGFAGLLEGNRLLLGPGALPTGGGDEEPDATQEDVAMEPAEPPTVWPPGLPAARPARDNRPTGSPREESAAPPFAGPSIKFDLPRGNVIEIRMRAKVTREEFEKVKRIFDLSEFAFVEDELPRPEKTLFDELDPPGGRGQAPSSVTDR